VLYGSLTVSDPLSSETPGEAGAHIPPHPEGQSDASASRAHGPLPGAPKFALGGFSVVLRNRDFRRLLWGQGVSALGDWVGTLAFIVAAQKLAPGRPEAVAIVLVLRLLPSFVATPIGGVLSDRWDRKKIMINSDIARFAIIGAVPFVPKIGALYAFAFAHECFSLVFLPARDASLPNIVPAEHLEAANALVMGSSYGGIPLSGPIFAGLAYAGAHFPSSLPTEHIWRAHPYSFAFAFDAFTFLVSAALIKRMHLPPAHARTDGEGVREFFRSIREGERYVLTRPFLRGLAFAVSIAMLGGGVLFALGVGYVHETLGGGDVEFGWLMGIFGGGMLIGFVLSQVRAPVAWVVRAALFTMGAVLVFMAVFPVLAIGYLAAAGFGAAFSTSLIVAMSTAQARTDDEHRGRVMAAVHMLVRAALSLGALFAGGIAALVPDRGVNVFGLRADKNQLALIVAGGLIAAGTLSVRREE
jgi:dTMP kinase